LLLNETTMGTALGSIPVSKHFSSAHQVPLKRILIRPNHEWDFFFANISNLDPALLLLALTEKFVHLLSMLALSEGQDCRHRKARQRENFTHKVLQIRERTGREARRRRGSLLLNK
jgi:hypothetical protein